MTSSGGATVHCDELPWLPLAQGVDIRVIKTVPETGAFSVMVRSVPGGLLPRPRHIESAEIYIIKGRGVHRQTGAFREGDYIAEHKGALHDELLFPEGVELLMVCAGPSEFLGADDEVVAVMDVAMLEGLSKRFG